MKNIKTLPNFADEKINLSFYENKENTDSERGR
jgi:hypothetical protein